LNLIVQDNTQLLLCVSSAIKENQKYINIYFIHTSTALIF